MNAPFRITRDMRSRKTAALDFIKAYWARWGRSPSQGEIAGHLGVSRQRARELVQALSTERQIEVVKGKKGGITLPDRSEMISVADALLRLQAEGYIVMGEEEGTGASLAVLGDRPLSYPPLSMPPDLDYLPDVGDDGETRE